MSLKEHVTGCLDGFSLARCSPVFALDAMSRINRHVFKLSWYPYKQREYGYSLKHKFLETLTENNHLMKVTIWMQVLRCRCDNGTHYDYHGNAHKCFHCGGNGIYRETPLHHFHFISDRLIYKWHIPSSLVGWKNKINVVTEMGGSFEGRVRHKDDRYHGTKHDFISDLWLVWWWIVLNGGNHKPPFSLYRFGDSGLAKIVNRMYRWYWYRRNDEIPF